ncbi:MAG: PilW family protein [Haliea sp.]|uniref:PilW family protein n=1 Tax=Haliea sp. TaxID=1932666 RepID=UPI0032ECAC5B
MQRHPLLKTRTGGFSLIEFMVAMVLGIILIGGAVSVYLASKRSYTEVEQVAALSENGRFALQILNDSLRHAGFFGAANPRDVRPDGGLAGIVSDCTGDAAALDTGRFLVATSADVDGDAYGCVTDALPNTDVLVVKQALPRPLRDSDPNDATDIPDGVIDFPTALSDQDIYIIANSEAGLILDGADTPPDVAPGGEFALAEAWPYRVYVYYVRDAEVPTLSRRELTWNGAALAMDEPPEDLVEGVENFRVMFGLANPATREVNRWVNMGGVADWDRVAAVEVFLLLRSATTDTDYRDEKAYQLGDLVITPATDANYDETTRRARRLLVHSAISLRNPKLVLRGGA